MTFLCQTSGPNVISILTNAYSTWRKYENNLLARYEGFDCIDSHLECADPESSWTIMKQLLHQRHQCFSPTAPKPQQTDWIQILLLPAGPGGTPAGWPDLAKFQHFGKILKVFGQVRKHYLVFDKFWRYISFAFFHCFKWPNIDQIIIIKPHLHTCSTDKRLQRPL